MNIPITHDLSVHVQKMRGKMSGMLGLWTLHNLRLPFFLPACTACLVFDFSMITSQQGDFFPAKWEDWGWSFRMQSRKVKVTFGIPHKPKEIWSGGHLTTLISSEACLVSKSASRSQPIPDRPMSSGVAYRSILLFPGSHEGKYQYQLMIVFQASRTPRPWLLWTGPKQTKSQLQLLPPEMKLPWNLQQFQWPQSPVFPVQDKGHNMPRQFQPLLRLQCLHQIAAKSFHFP